MTTTETPKVVPVTAFGRRFRSTTEARWAVFLTELGVAWEYEPETYDLGPPLGWYLPDFWLPRPGWFLEVKPGRPELLDEDYDRARALHVLTRKPVLVASGFGRPSDKGWDHDPGWIYDVFASFSGIDSAGAGGGGMRLALLVCGDLDLVYRSEGTWWAGCRQHRGSHIDREALNRAFDAGLSFRAGERR